MSKRKEAILAALSEVSAGSVHAPDFAEIKASIDHSGTSAEALRSLSKTGSGRALHVNHAATAVVGGVLRSPGAFVWRADAQAGEKAVLSPEVESSPAGQSLPPVPSMGAALRTVNHPSSSARATTLMGGGLFALGGLTLGIVMSAGTLTPVLLSTVGFLAGSKIASVLFPSH
jgi:hypothetical protein